ncbi:MAG TPA: Fe2+-dependent dioxygenase [Vitreimonas sp.]|uniref:Fe2+-dependent dioxygenase n=1 Tax=Vitreimonas sp. TaxID=3069702 RepID=UPI002D681810|nr:Fe2+-dependent dioxygenase [Vitreimonas sp.]HYD89844.1 Fe2+-dependent dioxygenase [Vitreimonas sp.]
MFLETHGVLPPREISRLRQLADELNFVDGRISNPANETKINQQADPKSPLYAESSNIVMAGLGASRPFRDFALPKRIAPPMLARYRPGMQYGAHTDAAYVAVSQGTLRSDVSATVFLSEPDSYQGGELIIHLGTQTVKVKGRPGSAIIYPSTTLHQVAPVTAGERLVSVTFVQSLVADEARRTALYELSEVSAREGLTMKWDNRVRLEGVRNNLMRMWASD